VITQAATGLSSVAAVVVAHAQTTAPAKPGAVLFWRWSSSHPTHQDTVIPAKAGIALASASASASAPAPSLARSAGEGWGGVASASASASAVAFAFAVAVAPALAPPGPLPQRRSRRTRPRRGGVHGCTSFFDDTGMYRRKIPAAEWTRGAQRRGRGGRVCFLLVSFSLHKQRKVTRSPTGSESLCFDFDLPFGTSKAAAAAKPESKAFAPLRGESAPFFACAKKRGPKRRLFSSRMAGQAHPAYVPSALRAPGSLRWQDFSTIHPCIVEKRRASVCVAPFEVLSASSVAAEGDPVEHEQRQEPEQLQLQLQLQKLPLLNPPLPCAARKGAGWSKDTGTGESPKHPHPNPSPASQERGSRATAEAAALLHLLTQSLKVFSR